MCKKNCDNVSDQQIRDLFTSQNQRHEEVTAYIAGYNLNGYPIAGANIMDHSELNRLAALNGMDNPDYVSDYKEVYRRANLELGASFKGQWIPDNPLTMGKSGYEGGGFNATTGKKIILDGMAIEEPEDVVEHLERFVFPRIQQNIKDFDKEKRIREIGVWEYKIQMEIGLEMLKTGRSVSMPRLDYFTYGYENYFMAYQLYEDVIEKHIKLQAEYCLLNNDAVAEAYKRYNLPKTCMMDQDLTDSRGTLVSLESMERIWFPQLDYCLQPILKNTDVGLMWHCDGNIMPMVQPLLDIGISGFQGFQYEDGVDFAKFCKMRRKDGRPLRMLAGVSVTTTLPYGTPADVRAQMDYLVEVHGDTALALGCSSSVAPGVPSANIDALREGFKYYKTHRK